MFKLQDIVCFFDTKTEGLSQLDKKPEILKLAAQGVYNKLKFLFIPDWMSLIYDGTRWNHVSEITLAAE